MVKIELATIILTKLKLPKLELERVVFTRQQLGSECEKSEEKLGKIYDVENDY